MCLVSGSRFSPSTKRCYIILDTYVKDLGDAIKNLPAKNAALRKKINRLNFVAREPEEEEESIEDVTERIDEIHAEMANLLAKSGFPLIWE
jgi:DNA repair ATPase RecN